MTGFPFWARVNQAQNIIGGGPEICSPLQVHVDFRRLIAPNLKITLFFHARDFTGSVRLRANGTYGSPDGSVLIARIGVTGGGGYGTPFTSTVTIANTFNDFTLVKLTIEGSSFVIVQPGFFMEGVS